MANELVVRGLKKVKSGVLCFAGLFPSVGELITKRLEDPVCEARFLREVACLKNIPEDELLMLTRIVQVRHYKKDASITRTGEQCDGLYIVKSGKAISSSGTIYEEASVFGFPADCKQDGPSTEVTAVQDCTIVWMASAIVELLNLRPRLPYEFAVVLKNHGDDPAKEYLQQREVITNLTRAGIEVTILEATQTSREFIVLLLNAPSWLISREDKLLRMERAVEYLSEEDAATIGEDYEDNGEVLTPANRLEAWQHLLTRSVEREPRGAGIQGIEENKDEIIQTVFPLHDAGLNDFFFRNWSVGLDSKSKAVQNLALNRLKNHFGLQVAFYFAYIRLYTVALAGPSILGPLIWIIWRWADYSTYQAGLGFFGMFMALIWAPLLIKLWRRKLNELKLSWGLLQAHEIEYENPNFKHDHIETVNIADPGEKPDLISVKVYNPKKRWLKFLVYIGFFSYCTLILAVFLALYIQWYIVAVMTPACVDPRCDWVDSSVCLEKCTAQVQEELGIKSCQSYCEETNRIYGPECSSFLGCFASSRPLLGTGRWFYIFIQGVVLGITIDILFTAIFEALAAKFNEWENWRTQAEKTKGFVMKTFLFTWLGYFYWFLVLAFLYIPYGSDIQTFIMKHIDPNKYVTFNHSVYYARQWDQSKLAMDSAFVTPLVVTQGLNLLVNTFLPWLGRKAILAARSRVRVTTDSIDEGVLKMKQALKEKGILGGENAGRDKAGVTPSPMSSLSPSAQMAVPSTSTLGQKKEDSASSPPLSSQDVALTSSIVEATSSSRFAKVSAMLHERLLQDFAELYDEKMSSLLYLKPSFECRSYNYTADTVLEEGGLSFWSSFSDLLHQCIQFSYITLFSVVWPFCALCGYVNNKISFRFDLIKLCIDFKRPIPQRMLGIGTWENVLFFEAMLAAMIVPGLYVACTGGFDAYFGCGGTDENYGPSTECLGYIPRLVAFIILENLGLGIIFLVNSTKSDISTGTKNLIAYRGRKMKHKLRESLSLIGKTILIESPVPHEWREASVAWIKKGKLKVHMKENIGDGSPLCSPPLWLDNERWLEKSLVHMETFDVNNSVLIMDPGRPGVWTAGKVCAVDDINVEGKRLEYTPDKLLLTVYQASGLKDDELSSHISCYCLLTIGDHVERTIVSAGTSNPHWNESYRLHRTNRQETLKVAVYNTAGVRDHVLGEVQIPLSQLADGKQHTRWYELKVPNSNKLLTAVNVAGEVNREQESQPPRIRLGLRWADSRLPTRIQLAVPGSSTPLNGKWLNRQEAEVLLRAGIEGDNTLQSSSSLGPIV